ncbi:MAG: hypothetical protein JSW51_01120 [Gemmatimonadota bacterium]|nr:MAG: hypothetical protein JSW51_01120 [Gemmatimonadota bacterium]
MNHAYHTLRVTALTPEEEARLQKMTQAEQELVWQFGEAELTWRRFQRQSEGNGGKEVVGMPLRAVWPARTQLHTDGGTQSCALCLDDIPEPYTICDVCGIRFVAYFKEQHGIDLDAEEFR